jgi:hypothetical protein
MPTASTHRRLCPTHDGFALFGGHLIMRRHRLTYLLEAAAIAVVAGDPVAGWGGPDGETAVPNRPARASTRPGARKAAPGNAVPGNAVAPSADSASAEGHSPAA